MGWWRIDPETGKPAEGTPSKLSGPGIALLNAIPGVDDEADAHYLGDGPWDMAASVADEIEAVIGTDGRLSLEEVRGLLLQRAVPPRLAARGTESAAQLLRVVDAFWPDVDSCYEDDWDRPARPAEKRWVCEYAAERLTGRS
jgi:hypothetical protein